LFDKIFFRQKSFLDENIFWTKIFFIQKYFLDENIFQT
jgi:hypothetical protein